MVDSIFEKVQNLCVRRGLVFPSNSNYAGVGGFFDYSGYGFELKENIKKAWFNFFVYSRNDIVPFDGSIIGNPLVWKVSGHTDNFSDLIISSKATKKTYRLDHLIEDFCVKNKVDFKVEGKNPEELIEFIKGHDVKGENGEHDWDYDNAKPMNLMFQTQIGVGANSLTGYLRPETAQSIFSSFKMIYASSRKKLPFGIAQAGKSFRNEISPRNFTFRSREFSQMELEYFYEDFQLTSTFTDKIFVLTEEFQETNKPEVEMSAEELNSKVQSKPVFYWLCETIKFLDSIGLNRENIRLRQHVKKELSHYSSETWDIEFDFSFGFKELIGIADRGDFDLSRHLKESTGKETINIDGREVKIRVVEPAFGLDRLFLAVLNDAYSELVEDGETKTILKLSDKISPVQYCVFPLMKKDGLPEKALEIFNALKVRGLKVEYDDAGSIGKRYARADEVGIAYCLTIDYDTLEKNDFTIRQRDSREQKRVKLSDII